jgi:hypothetical protein
LSAALFLILPFAALTRPRGTPDVDHAAVAHLVRTQSLSARTSARAALAVLALSGLLVPGAVWRMVLVQTSSRTMTHPGWVRSPAGSSVLSLLPEVLALVLVVAADFERIEGGEVGVYAWRTTRARQATLYKSDSWSTATSGPSEKASEAGASETSEASTAATVTDV